MWTLPLFILAPLVSAVLVLLVGRWDAKKAAPTAFLLSLVLAAFNLKILCNFDFATPEVVQYACSVPWIPQFGITFSLGIDSISLWLILLTSLLTPLSILGSFKYIKTREPEFYAWLLILYGAMLTCFCARDVVLFYLAFEFTLVPMFFLIGIWGGTDRRKAAVRFFLYTFFGSVFLLAAVVYTGYLYYASKGVWSFDLETLYAFGATLPTNTQILIFLGLLCGFAVKIPLFPVHTWLPLAHTEAPTAGSVLLAGILLKLGTYGLIRISLPMFPDATLALAPWLAITCIVGIIYGALISWVQTDMKKLIAYSSVSHLGFCVLGMLALTQEGMVGSIMYMINHGLSTGALFLVVGMIYERYHTRSMDEISGLARQTPVLASFAVLFVLSSVALPGLNGFVSEFLVLIGTFTSGQSLGTTHAVFHGNLGPYYAVVATTGVILGAVYLLYWTGRVVFGPLKEPAHDASTPHEPVKDLSFREWCVLSPLAIGVIVLGVYPQPVLDSLRQPVINIQNSIVTHEAPVNVVSPIPNLTH